MFPKLVRYVICWHPVYIHNKNLLVNQTHAQNMYFRLFEKIKTLKVNSDGRMGSKLAFTESSKSSSRAHFTQSCSRLLYHSGASMPLWSPLDLRTTHNPTSPIWTSELSDSNRAKAGSDLLIRTIFPSILPHSCP